MFSYGNIQNPNCPGPECFITIVNPSSSSNISQVEAIVDSGAVMTCVPESIIQRLGNLIYSRVTMQDASGSLSDRITYFVNIEITDDRNFQNLEVIAIPKRYALIGRDILNQNKVVLYAQQQQWILNCQRSCGIASS
jgi:hypothetical protein